MKEREKKKQTVIILQPTIDRASYKYTGNWRWWFHARFALLRRLISPFLFPSKRKESISCGNGVVESKVNARAEETHTMVRAILSLRGNDNTWLHTLLHADTSVPLLLWEHTDILSSRGGGEYFGTNSECKNVFKERQT